MSVDASDLKDILPEEIYFQLQKEILTEFTEKHEVLKRLPLEFVNKI